MVTDGTHAATWQGEFETSNCVIALVALSPRESASQNRSRPTPKGETTPMPVITTPGCPSTRMAQIYPPSRFYNTNCVCVGRRRSLLRLARVLLLQLPP